MKKKTFGIVSWFCLLLCMCLAGWWYQSMSTVSVVNWGSGELWAARGKFVMLDQPVISSPETTFALKTVPYNDMGKAQSDPLKSAIIGYYSAPARGGNGLMRNLVVPMWLLVMVFAFPPLYCLVKKNRKKDQPKPKEAH